MSGLFTQFPSEFVSGEYGSHSIYLNNNTTDGRLQIKKLPVLGLYNVLAHGAVGDDSTDNTAALVALIAIIVTAGGGTMYFPDGIYQTDLLNLTGAHNISLVGNGFNSVIKLNAAQSSYLFHNGTASNVSFRYLAFDGNASNQTASGFGIFKLEASASNIDGFEVDHCKIFNSRNQGIRAVSGNDNTGLRLTNNLWKDVGIVSGHAINIEQHCPGALIAFNEIDTVANTNGNGIWLGNDSDYSRIIGNYIHDVADMGMEIWQNNAAGHIVIANNVLRNTGTGSSSGYGISIDFSPHCSVTGNTLIDIKGNGIELVSADHCTISGNTIEDLTGRMSTGIQIDKTSSTVVSGNSIVNCDGASIRLYSDTAGSGGNSDFNVITGNKIQVHATTTNTEGIECQNNHATTSISHNRIADNIILGFDQTGSSGINWRDDGPGTCTGNVFENNTIKDFVTGIVIQASVDAGNVVRNNTYHSCATDETISDAGTILHTTGAGAPTVAVADGSTFHRNDGGALQGLYIRTNGAWEAK